MGLRHYMRVQPGRVRRHGRVGALGHQVIYRGRLLVHVAHRARPSLESAQFTGQ